MELRCVVNGKKLSSNRSREPVYVVYGRHSALPQDDGSSEERQLDLNHYRKHAAELGLPFLEHLYYDRHKSGFHGDNLEAEFGRMMFDIQNGDIPPGSVIGTESHSRLGRLSANEALYQYLDILRAGIGLGIKGRKLRTWDSIGGLSGVLVLIEDFIDMVIAHKHSVDLQKIERDTNALKLRQVREGIRQHTMKKGGPGWYVGDRCPAWLDAVEKPVIINGREYLYAINESVASVVRQIFYWADSGIGTRTIAARLNAMNFAPLGNKRRRDEKKTQGWTHGMVLALLKNRAVIGEWQPFTRTRQDEEGNRLSYARKIIEGSVIEHYYPPLFSNDPYIFRRVREALAKRRGHDGKQKGDGKPYAMGGAKGRDFGNLFTGLITCQCCGGPVTKQSGPHPRRPGVKLRYLRSENYRNKQRNGCITKFGFDYDRFERLFLGLFDQNLRPLLAALAPNSEQDNEPLGARLSHIESQIAKKCDAHHEREIELDDLTGDERRTSRQRMRELLAEIGQLATERDHLARAIREADGLRREDFDERVRAGIARLTATDRMERRDARCRLNALLKERVEIVLHPNRTMTVGMRDDRHIAAITFDREKIIDAGLLDDDGRRLLGLDDITILLANAKLGLVDLVESQMKSKQALAEAWAVVEASGINKAA